jgi:hypothetical protein
MNEEEIVDEVNYLISLATDLAKLYKDKGYTDLDLFYKDTLRFDIDNQYQLMTNEILMDLAKMYIYGFEVDNDKIEETKAKIRSVVPYLDELDEILDRDPNRKYLAYLPIMREFMTDGEEIGRMYELEKPKDLEEFLIRACTCNCGRCDYTKPSEQNRRKILMDFARAEITKNIIDDNGIIELIKLYIEGEQLFHKRVLFNNINLN